MNHFNIIDTKGNNIGNGGITTNNKEVIINVIEYNGTQYAELKGSFKVSGCSLNFKTGEGPIFHISNVNSQYFNLSDLNNNHVGIARFNNSLKM